MFLKARTGPIVKNKENRELSSNILKLITSLLYGKFDPCIKNREEFHEFHGCNLPNEATSQTLSFRM